MNEGALGGRSKAEVFQSILEIEGTSPIQPGNIPAITVTADRIADLPELMEHDAIVLRSDASQTVIYSEGDTILRISHSGVGWKLAGDYDSKEEIAPAIRDALLNGDVLRAFVTAKGYTALYDRVSVSTEPRAFDPEDLGFAWLNGLDTWYFHGPEKWSTITLEFGDGKLKKIVRRRRFGERL